MWDYNEKVMEYYRNPKNVGEIENADAVGEAGSLACGDALKLYLKIDNNGIVTDAKFQTFGCGSAVAASSALTEMIIGKPIEEVEKISNQDIVDFLGGLPEEKMHCSVMGHEALEDALMKFRGVDQTAKAENEDKVVCRCFGTTESKIREVIRENDIKTIDDVTNYCKAGGSCGRCKDQINVILKEELMKKDKGKPLSKTQMIIKVNHVLEHYISEQLQKDGGDIELIDVDENKVYVTLSGSCKNCPSSNATLKNFVQSVLRDHINDNIEVIEYAG